MFTATKIYCFRPRQWYNEPKVIVPLGKLIPLLEICSTCGGKCDVEEPSFMGSAVSFAITCQKCKDQRQWSNTDKYKSMPLVNLLLASSILFSGSLPTKFLRALDMIGIKVISHTAYFQYQRNYLHGVSQKCKMVIFIQIHPINDHNFFL